VVGPLTWWLGKEAEPPQLDGMPPQRSTPAKSRSSLLKSLDNGTDVQLKSAPSITIDAPSPPPRILAPSPDIARAPGPRASVYLSNDIGPPPGLMKRKGGAKNLLGARKLPSITHLVSFEANTTYHMTMVAEAPRQEPFAPDLDFLLRDHAGRLHDRTVLERDPSLAFLAGVLIPDSPVSVLGSRASAPSGRGPGSKGQEAGAKGQASLASSRSAPNLNLLGRTPLSSEGADRPSPLSTSRTSASLPVDSPSRLGSQSGLSQGLRHRTHHPMMEASGGSRAPSSRSPSRGATRGGDRADAVQEGTVQSSVQGRRPLLAPMVSSTLSYVPQPRRAILEKAANTFDRGQASLLAQAMQICTAVDAEPACISKELASYNAMGELARHRFFIPERADMGAGRIMGREKMAKVVEKVPWTLEASIWGPRPKWCDAQDFYDTETIRRRRFEAVWDRALRSGMRKFIQRHAQLGAKAREARVAAEKAAEKAAGKGGGGGADEGGEVEAEAKGGGKGGKEPTSVDGATAVSASPPADPVAEVERALREYARLFFPCFEFYSSLAGFSGVIGLNSYTQFIEDCRLSDQKSEFTRKSDLDRLFICTDTASKAVDAESETDGMNRSKALSVDEFLHALVQMAVMKYVMPGELDDVAEAVRTLFRVDIEPRCDANAFLDANVFRRDCCYHEATDDVLRRYEATLRGLWSEITVKRGPAKRLLSFEAYLKLMRRIELITTDLTERDVAFSFSWSRMVVGMPYSTAAQVKNKHLPFESFLEALCRIAVLKALPTDEEIAKSGLKDAGQYLHYLKCEATEEYNAIMSSRATLWGNPPRQRVDRCVDHLLSMIVFKIEEETCGHDMDVTGKELHSFFKNFDQS